MFKSEIIEDIEFDMLSERYRYKNKLRLKVIKLLGDECKMCKENDLRVLEIDHVFGDGCLERKKFSNKVIYILIIKAFELNLVEALEIVHNRYQVLCANCHKIKTYDNNEISDNFDLHVSNLGCIEQVWYLQRLIPLEKARKQNNG